MNKTHAKKKPTDLSYGALCGAKSTANLEFSDTPTCKRCQVLLSRTGRGWSSRPQTRPAFATVSGPRINPRNRNPHTFYSERKRATRATFTIGNPLSRRQQYDIVSRRLNAPPNSKLQIRVPSLSSE